MMLDAVLVANEVNYHLCYCFKDDCYFTNYQPSVYHISDIASDEGKAHGLVVGLAKTFVVSGVNVKDDDLVIFKCDNSIMSFPVKEARVVPELTRNFVATCEEVTVEYSVGSQTRAFPLTYDVNVITDVEEVGVLENKNTTIHLSGHPVAVGDFVKLVETSCDEDAPVFIVEASETSFFVNVLLETVMSSSMKVCFQFDGVIRYADTGFSVLS